MPAEGRATRARTRKTTGTVSTMVATVSSVALAIAWSSGGAISPHWA